MKSCKIVTTQSHGKIFSFLKKFLPKQQGCSWRRVINLLGSWSKIFNSHQPPWQENRRVKSLVSLLTWKMLTGLSLFNYIFFPFSLIFRFNVDEISIELLNFLNIENTQILNGSIRNSEFLLAWIILSRGILFIFPEGYFLRNHLGVYWCLLHISNEGSVNVKLWSSTVKAELWNKL